jgi:uncharacterized protein YndB with AHSA1/START domain
MPAPAEQTDKIMKSVVIRAPRSRVWKALTTMNDFAQWFHVKSSEEFKANTRVNMRSTYPGYEDIDFFVNVVEMQPESRFAWRWTPGDPKDGPADPQDQPTTVVFELEEVEGGTKVTVTESGFNNISVARRPKAIKSNTQGWEIQMQNLRDHVEQKA